MKTLTHYEKIILENICFDGYELENEPKTNFEKVQELYRIFSSEYKGKHNAHKSDFVIFSEWLQGLPSSLSVPFYNYDIIQKAKKAFPNRFTGTKSTIERKEQDFLNSYWDNLSSAFFTLKNNL